MEIERHDAVEEAWFANYYLGQLLEEGEAVHHGELQGGGVCCVGRALGDLTS